MAIEKIKILGAEYLSYVKSIATFAPTFYGYIISVLASVCPQQPPTEKVQNLKSDDFTKNNGYQNVKIKLNSTTWMTLECSVVIFQALEYLWPQ